LEIFFGKIFLQKIYFSKFDFQKNFLQIFSTKFIFTDVYFSIFFEIYFREKKFEKIFKKNIGKNFSTIKFPKKLYFLKKIQKNYKKEISRKQICKKKRDVRRCKTFIKDVGRCKKIYDLAIFYLAVRCSCKV